MLQRDGDDDPYLTTLPSSSTQHRPELP
ncbi:hypothetical protein A2U01_0101306, partial [Trifolium medium]|nr:hypothetical protein [Trifolium medium]